jgi:hypothetical protein
MNAEAQSASLVPSLKVTPATADGGNVPPLCFRQRFRADSTSLKLSPRRRLHCRLRLFCWFASAAWRSCFQLYCCCKAAASAPLHLVHHVLCRLEGDRAYSPARRQLGCPEAKLEDLLQAPVESRQDRMEAAVGRKKESILDDLFSFLKSAPVWAGPFLAVMGFTFFRILVPLIFPSSGFSPSYCQKLWMTPNLKRRFSCHL